MRYIHNRLEKAIKEDHIQLSVLFIKLTERLYNLQLGYMYLTELHHMEQEILSIDVKIANKYLGPEIGAALETAEKQTLEICKS